MISTEVLSNYVPPSKAASSQRLFWRRGLSCKRGQRGYLHWPSGCQNCPDILLLSRQKCPGCWIKTWFLSIRGLVKKVLLSADKNGIFAGTGVQCWALGPVQQLMDSGFCWKIAVWLQLECTCISLSPKLELGWICGISFTADCMQHGIINPHMWPLLATAVSAVCCCI